MTIFPSSGPASCNASGIMPHGTETTTTSPNPAACAGVPAATVVPIDPVSFSSASGWRLNDSISSWRIAVQREPGTVAAAFVCSRAWNRCCSMT